MLRCQACFSARTKRVPIAKPPFKHNCKLDLILKSQGVSCSSKQQDCIVDVKHATLNYGHCLAPVAVQVTFASYIDHCKMQV